MTASSCPACLAEQDEALLCLSCTDKLSHILRSVPPLVRELDVALSKQARIGTPQKSGKGGAHEKSPLNFGAAAAAFDLRRVLVRWANEITPTANLIAHAAMTILGNLKHVRRHPQVAELLAEISDAVNQARHVIDKPAERVFVGPCLYEDAGSTCHADLYARPDATHVTCHDCQMTHDVAERRAWLLQEAADRLVTVREAASYVGEVGGIKVTQASIRGLIHRNTNPLAYRPGTKLIRLGDLLDTLTTRAAAI